LVLSSCSANGSDESLGSAASNGEIDEVLLEYRARQELALEGSPDLQLQVFLFYFENRSELADKKDESLEYLRKSASAGLPEAEFTMGVLFDEGDVLPKSSRSASEWFERAAKQGHSKAKYHAGDVLYRRYLAIEEESEKEKAFSEAEYWWAKLAEDKATESQLNKLARYRLALAYAGRLIIDERAWRILFELADQGFQPAIESIGELRGFLVQGLNEGIAEVQPTLEMVDAFMDSRGVEQ
jgi:TPR repeat protein